MNYKDLSRDILYLVIQEFKRFKLRSKINNLLLLSNFFIFEPFLGDF
jgi:hypothetical protein